MAIVTSSTFRYNYQVFLSFRGTDTRNTFTDHLYTALIQSGLRTFRDDDEIERGKRLELELQKAIRESRISIIVLSKNYASSEWCLDEVVKIMEWNRSKNSGHEVLPIFYDVDPSDVRNQKGTIGEAFARYEEELIDGDIDDEKKKEWAEKLQSWKVALREVANLTGMVLQNQAYRHEAKFIQEIVKVVECKLNRAVLYIDRYLVGMHSRVASINSWVQSSSSGEDILVICGMGGIGKTTIAKFVYNSNFQRFEGSSFLASVKGNAQQPNGLINLQMQLLSSILKGKKMEIYDVDEGIIKIIEAICCKRVLLVIDDVDEVEQLDALLGTREFYPGSKIIITTRNKSLLKAHEVHKLHTVTTLDNNESLALFCLHAFGKEHPAKDYKEQSKKAVRHCRGLPLAHKVLGSSLAGKCKKVWESTLEKLGAIPEAKIQNVLKISFDSLQDDHDRNLFLHIACFFVGYHKDEAIEILNTCDFFTRCGIENLVDRCLISIDWNNNIMMHQLIQEMGWKIVDQESPNEPGRRSRLWRPKDSFIVLKEQKGTEMIEGLILDMQMYNHDTFNVGKGKKRLYDEFCDTFLASNQGSSFKRRYFNFLSSEPSSGACFNYYAFARMDKLSLLKLNYAELSGCCEDFPQGLRWLCWHGFSLKSIPLDLPLENLVSLDMSYSKLEQVWVGNKVLLSLKILNLSHSQRLMKTPNFGGVPNLEKLILKGCVSLVEVCDTIGNLERLALLTLENCKSLRKFPNIATLNSLQTLVVDGCSNIFGESPNVVDTNGVTINPSPSTFKGHVKVWHTFFQQWMSQPILKNPEPLSVSFPRFLVRLSLQNCGLSNDDFPLDLSQLSMLEDLDLSENNFLNLPRGIKSLSKLWLLNINYCDELHSISSLPNVSVLHVVGCTSLESISYQSTLTKPLIRRYGCVKLREVQCLFKLEPMGKINREILDSIGLCSMELIKNLKLRFTLFDNPEIEDINENIRQGLYEFGIFSTYLGQEEIPSWCIDGSNKGSSSVSFVVPSHPSLRIRGLNVYSAYTLSNPNEYRDDYLLFTKINNKTKNLCWIYSPVVVAVPEKENEEEQLVWVSHWKFGSQLESGDEVDVSVIAAGGFEVKEVGINIVWGEEEEEEINTREVIGGDLSSFELMTGFFFLYHMLEYVAPGDLFRKLFGDHVNIEDLPYLNKWMLDNEIFGIL